MSDSQENAAGTPKSSAKKKKEFKIDADTAKSEFENFCEANDIDYDEDGMKEEDREEFEPIKKRFIKQVMEGRLAADGRDLKYTISPFSREGFRGDIVEIKRPEGHAFMAMDGYKDTHAVHKLQAFIGSMTGKEIKYFSNIDKSDWLFFRDMATLFLAD